MKVKYKSFYVYQLSCGCWTEEPLHMHANTAICRIHRFRAFIIVRSYQEDNYD